MDYEELKNSEPSLASMPNVEFSEMMRKLTDNGTVWKKPSARPRYPYFELMVEEYIPPISRYKEDEEVAGQGVPSAPKIEDIIGVASIDGLIKEIES